LLGSFPTRSRITLSARDFPVFFQSVAWHGSL
jgi:hypothetical protein